MALTKSRSRMTAGAPHHVLDYGALGDGSTASAAAINQAIAAAAAAGGGEVRVSRGTYLIETPVILRTGVILVGEGFETTVFKMQTGANLSAVVMTLDFATHQAAGTALSDASVPHDYGMSGIKIDGNWMSDGNPYTNPPTINNTSGYGLKSYGFGFRFDLEVRNCAQVGVLLEGEGSPAVTQDASASLVLQGQTFQKEGLIVRGPGDIEIEKVWIGRLGLLKMPDAQTGVPVSDEWRSEPVTLDAADGTGTGAYGTAYLTSGGAVQYVIVESPGSGYTAGETVNIVPRTAGGTGATGTVTISNGNFVTCTVTAGGSGFVNRTPCDGVVFEDVNLEVGTIHVYGCFSGTGFRTRNGFRSGGTAGACRLEANHIISESNQQQVHLDTGTYGMISVLSVRNLSLVHPNRTSVPSYVGPNRGLDVVRIDCRGFSVGSLQVFRNAASNGKRITGAPGLIVNGDNNVIALAYRNMNPVSGDPEFGSGVPLAGDAIHVFGYSNVIDAALDSVNGNGIKVTGGSNRITFTDQDGRGGYAVGRDAGATNGVRSNHISGSVWATQTSRVAFQSIQGTPVSEIISIAATLPSGGTLFSGTGPDHGRAQSWDLTATVGTTRVATKIKTQLTGIFGGVPTATQFDESSTAEQTCTVAHNFAYTPDVRQVQWSLSDSATISDGIIQYCRLNSIDATNLTFKIRMSTAATGAQANTRVNIWIE